MSSLHFSHTNERHINVTDIFIEIAKLADLVK